MNQKSLIHLYNSMFDDSESDEEIKDSVSDSHEKLNSVLSKTKEPELFNCILKIIDKNKIRHISNYYLRQSELDQINEITKFNSTINEMGVSPFDTFNPKDGDFSIIFKYLRNIEIIEENAFYGCLNLLKIKFPDTIKRIYNNVFDKCKNIEDIEIPKSIEILDLNFLSNFFI